MVFTDVDEGWFGMNGDVMVRFEGLLAEAGAEMDTLYGLEEALQARMNAVAFARLLEMQAAGWVMNADGLRCERCDGRTWGRQVGIVETVRCVRCGYERRVVVG